MKDRRHNDDVILNELKHIKEGVDEIKTDLKEMNGNVRKNTGFRYQQKIINIILGTVGSAFISAVVIILIRR